MSKLMTHAGMVARAHVLVDPEALPHYALAVLDRLGDQRPHSALLIQHAFGRGYDDLGSLGGRGQGFAQRIAHQRDAIGAVDLPDPGGADAPHGIDDGIFGQATLIFSPGGRDVLPARGGAVEVVDDQDHTVLLVEDRVAHARGQAIVPEPANAHHGDRPLPGRHVEGRGRGGAEPVPHGGRPDVEGRQDREQVAADIGRDVVLAEFLFDKLHRREDRSLGAADAEPRGAGRHHFGEALDLGIRQNGRGARHGRPVAEQARRMGFDERFEALHQHGRRIFAALRQDVLAAELGLDIAPPEQRVQRLLNVFGLAFLDHDHRLLAKAEVDDLLVDHRIGHVHHIDRYDRVAVDVGEPEILQRPHDVVVHAALDDQADIAGGRAEKLVELARPDKVDGGGPAGLELLLLVHIGGGRQHDPAQVTLGVLGHGRKPGMISHPAVHAGRTPSGHEVAR